MSDQESIIKKTDSAVKTVGAWWSFLRDVYQLILVWLALGSVISAGIIQILQSALAINWGWYLAIVPTIFMIVLLWLRFFVWKWRVWNVDKQTTNASGNSLKRQSTSERYTSDQIVELSKRIKSVQDHIAKQIVKNEETDAIIAKHQGLLQTTRKQSAEMWSEFAAKMEELRVIREIRTSVLLQISNLEKPDQLKNESWTSRKEATSRIIGRICKLEYHFDKEGLHLPYFDGSFHNQWADPSIESEYEGQIGLLIAGVQRLDEAEIQVIRSITAFSDRIMNEVIAS